ncbi:hypothetical protein H3T41_03125 [Lactobacillus sp. W8089]|nr:hypothetical protein [Lactobacillus sp. W8086]MBI0108690.1 hypothetical protein [Lactobacillus sp. W8085]MBI0111907.1 hypothetical protein [Lactobacillus sp. W8088]MBI0115623.1 hypothetical protein [Lactobacillus sp. W8087]MBI0119347.1 hypothetical protein [Lactobacillus sp. W8089]MBI0131313.1 hypothetical protein [Lactobacillus sp. W8090]
MKKKRIIQFCLFALMLGLSVFIFANQTLAADKQNTNNNITVSENTINPIKATSVAFLQSGKSNTMVKNTPNMPIFPVSRKLVKSGVTDPYLDVYTNYDDNHTPLPAEKQDLIMDSDGNGGYIAHVYTVKGFMEAIFDPACSSDLPSSIMESSDRSHANEAGWEMNCPDQGGQLKGWKEFETNGTLYGKLNARQSGDVPPLSKIHKIILENNINTNQLSRTKDSNLIDNYHINVQPEGETTNGIKGAPKADYTNVDIRHDNLIIDGRGSDGVNHYLNMGWNNLAIRWYRGHRGKVNSSQPYKEDWTLENMDTYGITYWGIVSANSGLATNYLRAHANVGDTDPDDKTKTLTQADINAAKDGKNGGYSWFTYKNMSYTGSQLAWTATNRVAGTTILGNVISRSVYSYKEPGDPNYVWKTESSGTQQIFQVDHIIFGKNCHFTGSTYNANAIELTGSASLESGAKVDLYPHGNSTMNRGGGPEDSDMSLAWGFLFSGTDNPALDLYGDSQLNIHCDNHEGNDLITPSEDGSSATWQPGVTIAQEQAAGIGNGYIHQISSYTAGALDMMSSNASINYHETTETTDGIKKTLSPEINIEGKGPVYGNHPLVNFAGGNAQLSHGKFSIKATNLNNQEDVNNNNKIIHYTNTSSSGTGGLMAVTGSNTRIEVKTGGDFSISASNDKDDDVTGSPVNLLYLGSGALINLMNPKNVSLDLRNNNDPASALVYSYTNSKINAYDTRIQAYGDNDAANGLGVNTNNDSSLPGGSSTANFFLKQYNDAYNANYTYNNGQKISLGMQRKDGLSGSINGGVYKREPIRMQTLTLPFFHYGIAFTNYLSQPADNVIQGHHQDLDLLKAAMVQMNGREFRYVRLSDLPGPTEDAVDKVGVPGASQISQKDITGKVGGDYWANDYESTNPLFSPVPPLLRVQLKHKNSDSLVDLGTMPNVNAAQEKTNADYSDPGVTEVTPNPIDSNRNVRTDDKGNYMTGTKITTDGDTSNPQPHYLDSSIVKWDNGSWSNTSSSENDPQHSFSYNLQDVINKYNDNHTDKKISFQPGDQVLTSVVTNYQETPVQNTRITNLYLQKGKEPKTPFLVGDQIEMPFQYIDTIDNASPLHIKGTIYKLDDNGKNPTPVQRFDSDDIPIKKTSSWLNSSLYLPTENPGATSEPGNYVVEFNGTDKLKNTGPDKDVSWNYTVSNLPKYNGKKVLNDHTTGDTTKPGNIVSNLHYTVKTIFEAVNTTNGTLSKVMFNHPSTIGDGIDNRDINIEENSDYTLTASYIDNKQTINKPLNSNLDFGYDYKPKDFGISTDNFPAGVKFTITHKILVKKKAKDDPDKLVKIGADQMYSKEGNDGEDILLGTSNSIQYNSVGSIVLNVDNNTINYGTNPVAVPLKKERVFFIPKAQDPIVSVTNNTPYSQPIILTAQVDGDTSGLNSLNNWLYYRKTEDNTDYSDTPMTNKVTVFHDSVGTNVSQNISSRWFNKDGKQVTGPILKLEQNSSPNLGTQHKYKTKITWNLTNSL